jgi:tetratricopeptide (TPR) repeat protein
MAPEQLRVLARRQATWQIDGRTDLFSLGIVLYELLSGRLPWGLVPPNLPPQRVAEELLERHARGPEPLRGLVRGLNPGLARIIERCLAQRPDERPATASELGQALRGELGWAPRGMRFTRQHRRAVLATIGSALALGGVGAGFWITAEPGLARSKRLGKEALEAQDYAAAIAHFRSVLDADPENHEARFLIARAHLLTDDYAAAQEELRLLDRALPQCPHIAACLGYCVAATANSVTEFSKASAQFQRAAGRLVGNAALCNNLGYCSANVGRWSNAIRLLKESVQINPNSAVSHHNLAVACLGAALETRSDAPNGQQRRAQLLDDAEAQMRLALELDDAVARYHTDLVLVYATCLKLGAVPDQRRQSVTDAAVAHCRTALSLGGTAQDVMRATERYPRLLSAMDLPDPAHSPYPARRALPPKRLLDPLQGIEWSSLDLS